MYGKIFKTSFHYKITPFSQNFHWIQVRDDFSQILILFSIIFSKFFMDFFQFSWREKIKLSLEKIFVKKCIKIGISKYFRVVGCAVSVAFGSGSRIYQNINNFRWKQYFFGAFGPKQIDRLLGGCILVGKFWRMNSRLSEKTDNVKGNFPCFFGVFLAVTQFHFAVSKFLLMDGIFIVGNVFFCVFLFCL